MSDSKSPLPAISDLDHAGITALVAELGLEKYRSAQILDAVWRSDATTWAGVTTLSKRAQETLAAVSRFYSTEAVEREAPGDHHHPRERTGLRRVVVPGPAPDLHEGVLQRLLGRHRQGHLQQACGRPGDLLIGTLGELGATCLHVDCC